MNTHQHDDRELEGKTWLDVAFKYYNNPTMVGIEDFYDDMRRIKYLKRLCIKYQKSGNLSDRLILNHIIILGNVFHPPFLFRLLTVRLRKFLPVLKPFMIYCNLWCHDYPHFEDIIIMDPKVIEALRSLNK